MSLLLNGTNIIEKENTIKDLSRARVAERIRLLVLLQDQFIYHRNRRYKSRVNVTV